jgi:stage II sporulation protein AA (anti-sigma F factor antagonist)
VPTLSLEVACEQRGPRLIVRVAGELDLGSAPAFRSQVDDWLDRTRCRQLLLNLRRVTFIDSVGLGAILGRLRHLQRIGGAMAIVEPAGPARTVLHVGGLGRVAAIFPTEQKALDAWEASERGA